MNPLGSYREAKERHPGMILLFRVGDFYELFDTDAETAARVLGLTLTVRGKVPMAGFPHHSLETYLRKLLQAGHRVAICDQIEPMALPKRVEVNRIVTPGYVPQDGGDEDGAEEKPKTLTYIAKGGNWKRIPWMF